MSEVKFKVGDLVYCPEVSHKILKIDTIEHDCIYFEVGEFGLKIFTNDDSLIWENWIFHATQENYERLSATFPNIEFEPPPKRKEPREIIEAMIKGGWKMIPCCDVNDDRENPPFGIHVLSSSTFETVDTEKIIGKLIPFDPKTALEIIDFIDGKCVLENGEVME